MKRTSISLMSSAGILALLLAVNAPLSVTPAQASCAEDNDCDQTGEGMIPYSVLNEDGSSDSSEGDVGPSEPDNESSSDSSEGGGGPT